MKSFNFTATGFRGVDYTSGIQSIGPVVDKPSVVRVSVAENVRATWEGGMSKRLGFEKKATLSTAKKIDTMETHPGYDVMFAKSNTSIVQSVDSENWYDIGVTRTASERDYFFPNGKDMYVTNPTDSYLRIALSSANGAIAASDTEITVKTGDIGQFTTSGNIYINGDVIAYTGKSGSNLTGVTGIQTGGHADGSIITQTSTPADAPKGSCIAELVNRILVAGASNSNDSVIYNSDTYTSANPEKAYSFNLTTWTKPFPSSVMAMKGGEDVVLVGMKQGIAELTGFDSNGGLVHNVIHKVHGVPNAFCIAPMDKNFAILTNEGRVISAGATDAGFVILENEMDPLKSFDYFIQREVRDNADADQSLAFLHSDPARKELTASIIINGLSQEFVYQWDRNSWTKDTSKNFACRCNFKGRVYAGADDTSAEIYLDNEGMLDDNLPFISRIVTGKMRLAKRGITGDFLKSTYGGLLNAIGEFKCRIFVNGKQINKAKEDILASGLIEKRLMKVGSGVPKRKPQIPLGGGQVGAEQIGSGGIPIDSYEFKIPFNMLNEGEEIQLEYEISDEGTVFELRYFSIDGETEGELIADSI